MDEHGLLERLSPLDVSNLRVEDHGQPMIVAALFILDQADRAYGPGAAGLEVLRATVEQRLHLVSRLRQVLYRPRPVLGPPVWVDDAGFDIR
jgi:diacylglycerol O-acyltransferase / wax synthase